MTFCQDVFKLNSPDTTTTTTTTTTTFNLTDLQQRQWLTIVKKATDIMPWSLQYQSWHKQQQQQQKEEEDILFFNKVQYLCKIIIDISASSSSSLVKLTQENIPEQVTMLWTAMKYEVLNTVPEAAETEALTQLQECLK